MSSSKKNAQWRRQSLAKRWNKAPSCNVLLALNYDPSHEVKYESEKCSGLEIDKMSEPKDIIKLLLLALSFVELLVPRPLLSTHEFRSSSHAGHHGFRANPADLFHCLSTTAIQYQSGAMTTRDPRDSFTSCPRLKTLRIDDGMTLLLREAKAGVAGRDTIGCRARGRRPTFAAQLRPPPSSRRLSEQPFSAVVAWMTG